MSITLWRRPRAIAAFLLLAALCGCAAAPVAPTEAKALPDAPASHGIVVAVRPTTEASVLGPNRVRARILGAVGVASPAPREAMVEIIIRQDDGRTISVMQTNTDAIRPGERILLTRGAGTRVARPGV